MAKEIMPLPSEREMDMLLATGEQTTIALAAIAAALIGVPQRADGRAGGPLSRTASTPRPRF